ncbi:MAG: 5-formyltetrahydrofolate cyclo-ligase [Magnetococcales bacterium]|nr:5-formyltetrahydrofolate cyclo-ligase [Magnetococcales bacterium]NGZ06653.1 5-formyltetrahydrofolate cyclo-ligase [Magnetococcales bacterium]
MAETKASLRQRLRAARQALSGQRVVELSLAVVNHLLEASFYREARRIGLYFPIDHEVDPTSLFHAAERLGQVVFVPYVDPVSRSMHYVVCHAQEPLHRGPYGIPVPEAVAQKHEIFDLDLVCQPLIGFDRFGNRLGFGGGYFDRALAARSGQPGSVIRVGLAYSFQEVPSLPCEGHDVPMEWVVTECGVWSCRHACG